MRSSTDSNFFLFFFSGAGWTTTGPEDLCQLCLWVYRCTGWQAALPGDFTGQMVVNLTVMGHNKIRNVQNNLGGSMRLSLILVTLCAVIVSLTRLSTDFCGKMFYSPCFMPSIHTHSHTHSPFTLHAKLPSIIDWQFSSLQ